MPYADDAASAREPPRPWSGRSCTGDFDVDEIRHRLERGAEAPIRQANTVTRRRGADTTASQAPTPVELVEQRVTRRLGKELGQVWVKAALPGIACRATDTAAATPAGPVEHLDHVREVDEAER